MEKRVAGAEWHDFEEGRADRTAGRVRERPRGECVPTV